MLIASSAYVQLNENCYLFLYSHFVFVLATKRWEKITNCVLYFQYKIETRIVQICAKFLFIMIIGM